MQHTFIKIIAVEVLNAYSLRLHFSDGVSKEINFEHLLSGKLYEPLRNLDFFDQVKIENETGSIVWPNGADFDPDLLYAWNEHGAEFMQQVALAHSGY